MTTFIKSKLKKLNDQTNIDEYRVTVNITEYQIISRLIDSYETTAKFVMIR